MLNIGLRRLTYAPLESDTPSRLHYGSPRPLALSASGLSRTQKRAAAFFWDDGAPLFERNMPGADSLVLECSALRATALADVTGCTVDRNGALVATNRSPFFALGWESFAVDAENGARNGFERVWLYKCTARLGVYTRQRASASPKVQSAQLIVTVYPTRFLFEGAPLTDASLPPDTVENDAARGWFETVYLPQ